ncbi:uncharacterized protein LOC132918162 isoform X1 [Rhopalosiphum padi]|uniref:uncharacterized protein LOC132918162 isoform X1 n=2 Tax=Rhopalosiphum padi TaxID=40932 RepID=UPI00298EAA7C|nr:uncharacterized protein LOC132918162 isoform X1 [Rhopalosiphum padi]XP_060835263.1 uncharacterized protein LOC132918162 isoform X1 [Rhopalosiphum padi]XP_060835264.1 uncharacterized protein LOC132918162 isoform X1 [Rhopalosiphum padi]XP_060835267.1 uncharacterized protein LOC132918162 isoform X1 [Rhopalosiphum padi]
MYRTRNYTSEMAVNKGIAPEPTINLKVHGPNNYFVQFKMKIHTPMKKLMKAYCEGAASDIATLRFQFDGQSFSGQDTPFSLELEDGDVIEVFQHRAGVDGIWNKPSTSREEETTPYKISEKKIIQKDVTKMNITATSKTPLVGVIRPTNATNSVYDKEETGPLNGSLDNAGVAFLPEESEMPVDSNEQTYCLCKQVSYGKMIACDNSCCPIEWFHFGCVNVTTEPKGKWFCPKCKTNKMIK